MKRLFPLIGLWLVFSLPAFGAEGITVLETPRTPSGFALPNVKGGSTALSDFKGRYVLVNFWAVWCGPCREEMPSLQALHTYFEGQPFSVAGVHVGPDMVSAFMFSRCLGLTFPVVVDENLTLEDWGVKALPTTVLVDPDGRIIAEAVGDRGWNSPAMRERLRKLITRVPNP